MIALEARSPLAADAPAPFALPTALDWARTLGDRAPMPGEGRTRELWQLLAALGAADLQLARAVEPHLDALAILRQAAASGADPVPEHHDAVWGVFAAEGPGVRLDAVLEDGRWLLSGVKPWCSLAGDLDAALITAHVGDERRLFAVDLHQAGVVADAAAWVARGLPQIPSGPVSFERVDAHAVGAAGWYLERPGFAWGGIGVAACWYGGAVGIARTVRNSVARKRAPLLSAHLGAIDVALRAAALALGDAARAVDDGEAVGDAGALLALRVRSIVAEACETVLRHAAHALGPAPLALDDEHAGRVADLELYVRQHHAERDLAALGDALADVDPRW